MSLKGTSKAIQIVIALIGVSMVTYFSSWEVALGVFYMMWANNFERIEK